MSFLDKIDKSKSPEHVAIIMDGNGRWAKAHGLERGDGHREGINSVKSVVEAASNANVNSLRFTLFPQKIVRPDVRNKRSDGSDGICYSTGRR